MGCLAKGPVKVLTRVGIRPDGTFAIGRSESGRGAWIHSDSMGCLDRAIERRAFQRALRTDVDVDIARLRALLDERAERAEGVGG